jgi:dTDP-glucose 4,6-dehydratase
VDRSIYDPALFVRTNVIGTQILLEEAHRAGVKRFIQISTDEVYGSLSDEGRFGEDSPLRPNSPYAASKAAADMLALAFHKIHNFSVIVTRSSNNYGPYQFPEKLIPLFITNAFEDKPLPLYGKGTNIRDWLHVQDNCEAILLVMEKGAPGEVYNIGGDCERRNIEVTRQVLKLLGKSERLIRFVKDRPAHDYRYALDCEKIKQQLGWKPKISFEQGLALTVQWYRQNRQWWQQVKSGQYRQFYKLHYGEEA